MSNDSYISNIHTSEISQAHSAVA